MKLKDILPLLPKYDTNNAYGKIGDIKSTVKFVYGGEYLGYKELTKKIINNAIVERIEPMAFSYYNHSNARLWIYCKEKN